MPGFYNAVRPVSQEQQSQWQALGFDEAAFLRDIGLTTPGGERGVPPLQRLWSRPTADINGIWGGYAGHGSKTIIPSEASAKVSFRLVPDQDAQAIFEGFQRFVTDRLPPGDADLVSGVRHGARHRDRHRYAMGERQHAARCSRNTAGRP